VTAQRNNPASAELLAQLQSIKDLALEQLRQQAAGQQGGGAA
jgi:hypothetical protein